MQYNKPSMLLIYSVSFICPLQAAIAETRTWRSTLWLVQLLLYCKGTFLQMTGWKMSGVSVGK